MKIDELKSKIHSYNKGSFRTMETCKPLKTLKSQSAHSVMKISRRTVRLGVQYDHLKAVQAKRESGELPAVNQGLKWGEYVKGEEGYLITHKGNTYLRVTSSPNKAKTTYLIDSKVSTEEEAKKLCLASEFRSGERPDVMNINVEHIVNL